MGKFFSTVAVLALLGGLIVVGWDRIEPVVGPLFGIESESADPAPIGPIVLDPAPEPRERLALLDPTLSSDASFRESMKSLLVQGVGGVVPPKPETTIDGVPAVTGLKLVVRLVGTTPLKEGAADYRVDIPSVPGLPARPSLDDPDALTPDGSYNQWVAAEAEWSAAYDAALEAARVGTETLAAMDLNLDEWSAITAGVSALALVGPAGPGARMLVMSDLDENLPQQSTDLRGIPIDVIQPDITGDLATWSGLFASFTAWAGSSGSGAITRYRPEAAPAVIAEFLTGD